QQNVARNQALATKKAITIELNSASLPTAVLDASKMEQVLNNLLGNAIKFSPSGSRIKVQLEKADQNFRFSVRDEGPGMTPQEQAVLFTAFKQGRTGTQGEKSTGLGLVIVKRIVEGHGGKIWFESQSGHGTAFFVEMPILPPEL
ncbi:MAG TPA: two-component hybrid sensor and regulator, partial [Anaerolineae bacterium]|nr:two-component hybrid sensor and regulator [Anaerolineae bacterium]